MPEVGTGRLHGDLTYHLEKEVEIHHLLQRPCLREDTEVRAEGIPYKESNM